MSAILASLRHPLIQAPMAFAHDTELPLAVCRAGALGSLAAAMYGPPSLEQALQTMQDEGGGLPYNLNFFAHRTPEADEAQRAAWLAVLRPYFDELGLSEGDIPANGGRRPFDADALALLERFRPPVASFHFGLPASDLLSRVKAAGCEVWASATTVEEALWLEANGADVVIAQGWEAGGHRGCFDPEPGVPLPPDEHLSTAVLVRQLVLNTRLPLIAAGGIMDGHAIRAMQELGAAAAQLGTAFVACPESAANAAYRARLRSADAAHTRLTRVLSGRPARGIVSPFIDYGEAPDAPPPAAYPRAYDAAKQLHAAASRRGEHTYAAHWAGQGAPMIREIPAAQLVATLAQEWRTA